MFQLENFRETICHETVMSHNTESDAKFEAKLTLVSKNDFRSFENFHVSSGKSKNLDFNALLL